MYITKENFKKNNINIIQFIMAILVIYSHAFPIATDGNESELFMNLTESHYSFGNLGVATFLIFSGFLVSASYENTNNIFVFLKKRVFRIFPGLLAVLVLSALVLGPCVTTLTISEYYQHPMTWQYLKNIFLNPLYWNLPGVFESNVYGSSVNGSLWTIPYQFGFYVLLGVLGFLGMLKKQKVSLSLLATFIISYLMRDNLFAGRTHFLGMPLYDWLYLGMYFTAGMTAYAYRHVIRLSKQGAMIALSLLIFAWFAKEYFISTTICGTYLLLYLSYCTKNVNCSLDRLSFGVYIYGFPVQQLFTHLAGGSMNPYLNTILSIPVVVCLAWLSDKFFEAPIQKLEKYITLKKFIPAGISAVWDKCYSRLLRLVERAANISWKSYFAILLLGICSCWVLFVNLPSSVDFTKNVRGGATVRALGTGYYSKSAGETYTFVSDVSEVHLGQRKGMTELTIEGFIPANFTDVQFVSVYVNGNAYLTDQSVTAGQGYSFNISIPDNNTIMEKKITVRMVFNTVHAKEEGNPDIRDLSACVTAIKLNPSGI